MLSTARTHAPALAYISWLELFPELCWCSTTVLPDNLVELLHIRETTLPCNVFYRKIGIFQQVTGTVYFSHDAVLFYCFPGSRLKEAIKVGLGIP